MASATVNRLNGAVQPAGQLTEVSFRLTGTMPILMHYDDVEAADQLEAWRKAPENKGMSKAGDDRSPPWTWHTYLWHDGKNIAVPQQVIMTNLRKAGSRVIMRKQMTFKEATQSGLLLSTDFCEFLNADKPVSVASIQKLRSLTFAEQKAAVKDLGFDLDVRRAPIGSAKHVRVRPKFKEWEVRGNLLVDAPEFTIEILRTIFRIGGRGGLGDWRPWSPKSPGPFGQFTADVQNVK